MTKKKKATERKTATEGETSRSRKVVVRGPKHLRTVFCRGVTPKPVRFEDGRAEVPEDVAEALVASYEQLTLEGEDDA